MTVLTETSEAAAELAETALTETEAAEEIPGEDEPDSMSALTEATEISETESETEVPETIIPGQWRESADSTPR